MTGRVPASTVRRPRNAGRRAALPVFVRAVYALVRAVPRGTVVTYGQVAAILGHPRAARAVGTALSHLPGPLGRIVPWQRVINANGRISIRGDVQRPDLQRQLLELEGIVFRGGCVDLRTYRWAGPKRERRVKLTVAVPFDGDRSPTRRVRPRPKGRRA
jgi:methylated-DNA-protein-cysteine methyltransferase-like protein